MCNIFRDRVLLRRDYGFWSRLEASRDLPLSPHHPSLLSFFPSALCALSRCLYSWRCSVDDAAKNKSRERHRVREGRRIVLGDWSPSSSSRRHAIRDGRRESPWEATLASISLSLLLPSPFSIPARSPCLPLDYGQRGNERPMPQCRCPFAGCSFISSLAIVLPRKRSTIPVSPLPMRSDQI